MEPVLASGLRTLEDCLLAIRALFVVLLAEVPTENQPDDPYGEKLRAAFAVVLHDAADCLRGLAASWSPRLRSERKKPNARSRPTLTCFGRHRPS